MDSNRWRGGEGTVIFSFPNLLRRFDIELLLRVCWLDKVVLLVHCCVLPISCIQGTTLYPASCRMLSFSQFPPWMSILVAPVEHVELFNVKYSKNKWHTEPFSQ